jgi:hypothetical protein
VHSDPAARELDRDRAGKGELRVFGCAVGAGLPGRDRSGDGGDVHNVGGRSRLECWQECAQAPDRAEIVDADEPFDLHRLGVEKAGATRNPSIVDEQSDYGVALANGRGDALDLRAVGDVAELVLGSDLVRDLAEPLFVAGEQHQPPTAGRECARDGGANPARAAGDDCDGAGRN